MPDTKEIMDAFAAKVQATLGPFGIALDNPCDLSLLKDKIIGMTEEFLKEADESIRALSAEAVSAQFWPIVAQVLIEVFDMAEGAAAAYVDKIIGDLMSKGLGVVYSVVALLLTSLDSARIILDYLTVVALKKALEKRIEMNRVIEIDIRILIGFVKNLSRVIDVKKAKAGQIGSLILAKRRLETVLVLLAIEISKLKNKEGYAVTKSSIESAISGIKETVSDLTQGSYKVSTKLLNKAAQNASQKLLQNNTGFTAELVEIANVDELINIINKNIKTIIFEDVSNKNIEAHDYDSAIKAQLGVFNLYLSEVFPLIPDALQLVLAQELVGSSVNRLVKRMPILGGLTSELTKKATEWLATPAQQLQKVLPIVPSILNEPPILKNEPKLTWKRAMTAGKLAKSGVLLTPDYFAFLQTMSYLTNIYLRPAQTLVKDVHEDIKDAISNIESSTYNLGDVQLRKVKWIGSLLSAKSLLESTTPTITFEKGKSIDVAAALSLQKMSDDLLAQIKKKIQEFSYLKGTSQVTVEPGDKVHQLAQEYLSPLIASQAVLFSPQVLHRMIPGLIGIKTLLAQQHYQDLELLNLCNTYILTVGSSSTFKLAKAEFDALFNSVGAVDNLIDKVRNGDLSELVAVLDTSKLLSDIANMALCYEKDFTFDGLPSFASGIWDTLSLTWGSRKKFLAWNKAKDKMIADLKDKLMDLKDLIHVADEIVHQFTGTIALIKDFNGSK